MEMRLRRARTVQAGVEPQGDQRDLTGRGHGSNVQTGL